MLKLNKEKDKIIVLFARICATLQATCDNLHYLKVEKTQKNHKKESLAARLKLHTLPHQKRFFQDNNFGAAIGYSDYVSAVILLEDAVESVEFLRVERPQTVA